MSPVRVFHIVASTDPETAGTERVGGMASSYSGGGDQPERPSWTIAIVVTVLVVIGLVAYLSQ